MAIAKQRRKVENGCRNSEKEKKRYEGENKGK